MANVFFSYSHKDIDIRDEIDKHFSVLKRNKLIQTWYDREIEAGNEFDYEIKKELEFADIILLLVSSNFLNSQYCQDIEMKRALEKHKNNEAKVVPIIVDVCDWKHTELRKLKSLPNDGRPIKKYYHRNEAYQDITNEIRRLTNKIHNPGVELAKQLLFAATSTTKKTKKKNKILQWLLVFAKRNIKVIFILIAISYLIIISDKNHPPAPGVLIDSEYANTHVSNQAEDDSFPPWERTSITYQAAFREAKENNRAALRYNDGITSSITHGDSFAVIPKVTKERISIIDNQGKVGSVSHEFIKIIEPITSFVDYSIVTQPDTWLRSSPIGDDNVHSNRIRLLKVGEKIRIHNRPLS
jgi:hypothetical protein